MDDCRIVFEFAAETSFLLTVIGGLLPRGKAVGTWRWSPTSM